MGEHNERLTAVDKRFISRTRSALRSQLLTVGPTPSCRCNRYPCKACPGKESKAAWFHTVVEFKTLTYHWRVGAGRRTAGRWGGAGQGRMGRRRVGSPRKQSTLLPPRASRASKATVLNVSSEARNNRTPMYPVHAFNTRHVHIFASHYNVEFFGCTQQLGCLLLDIVKSVASKTRTYHGRVGAGRGGPAHGGGARRGAAGQYGTLTGRFAQETTVPLALQTTEDNCPERFFGSTN